MKITTKVRYGIRALNLLAEIENENSTLQISKMATEENLSIKYLENLMVKLRNAGLVESKRGKSGGYKLAKKANRISIAEIFMALDESFELVPCLGSDYACERKEICGTYDLWKDLSLSIKTKLGNITLETLKRNERILF